MKPNSQVSTLQGSRWQDRVSLQPKSRSPQTDYNFQAMIGEHSGDAGSPSGFSRAGERSAFRAISKEFLTEETHRSFFAELFLFGVIVLISAWPLFALLEAWTALPG
jgi:hypothetical protein